MVQRLDAASEETLLTLLQDDEEPEPEPRRLQLTVHKEDGGATLEFIAAPGEANLEDRNFEMSPLQLRVSGKAGCGKSILAREAFDKGIDGGRRPLLVCFNRRLAYGEGVFLRCFVV